MRSDLYKLIRQGLFKPGEYRGGSIIRTRVGSGERVGSVGYEAHMYGDCDHVRLHYTTTHAYNGQKRDSDYTIALETTSHPFGRCVTLREIAERRFGRRNSTMDAVEYPVWCAPPRAGDQINRAA